MTRILHTSTWPRWVRLTVCLTAATTLFISPTALAVGYTVLASRVSDTAKTAYVESCEGNNTVRQQVTELTDSLLVRSKKSTLATLASPTATPRQKLVAQQNLESGAEITIQIHDSLKPSQCVYPPVPTTTTTQGSS